MENVHYYDTEITWTSGRKGILRSSVLPTGIEVATPPQFSKGVENIWSPEHLLVAAVNSCLMTTFLAVAENSSLEYISFRSNAVGKLEIIDGKYLISEIVLKPVLEISNPDQKERAERVLLKSEKACLISNSVKATVTMIPEVKVVGVPERMLA
jgi:peroxiredoxin-like protein